MPVNYIVLRRLRTLAAVFLLLLTTACAAGINPALENARDAYLRARRDPVIVRNAGVALDRAAVTLEEADRRWKQDKDIDEVEHLAYITEKRVEIAKVIAQRRLTADKLQKAGSQPKQ
jgi:OOP family OmpA-OmpF porin